MLLVEGGLDYPMPVFCCQVLLFPTVEPPITVRTVKVAHIINVNRAVHRLFRLEELISCYFFEDANIKWHLMHKVSYASTIN
jgi:hypothetical protein